MKREMPDILTRPGPAPQGLQLTLTVNGEARIVPVGTSVAGLLAEIGLAERKVAVERNLEIVPRSQYAATMLGAGDAIEIVHFIGGG
jgi:sulfur carrier protein